MGLRQQRIDLFGNRVAFDAEAKLAARAFAADGTSATATSDLPVVDGNWHQLALVYDSIGTVTLMIDGKLSASATGTTPLPFQPAGGSVTTVGASGDSTPFVGTLDELALYSYAVPLSTISTRYRATQAEYPSTVLNEGGRSVCCEAQPPSGSAALVTRRPNRNLRPV